jgi:predicted helicase
MELSLKPTSARVKDYYNALNQFGQLNISHEMAVRQAFASLLDSSAKPFGWKLVPEFRIAVAKNKSVIVDGALLDTFTLRRGYWEAKDLGDNLEKEIKKKFELGYPRNNIIFQSPERAILFQNGVRQGLNEDITEPHNLIDLLKEFFAYREPQHQEWETAVAEFTPRIPEIAMGVKKLIDAERKRNKPFVAAFEAFVMLCRQAINPNLSEEAVETMLIQHLLTERIFSKVFENRDFSRRNIIAAEIEKVIDSLTSKHFSRGAFLKDLDYFYRAIEDNAKNAKDYSEKQTFLNTVYERFFQGFSKKEADTHGIVYTPQPIVNFMVRSVEEILKKEFGKSLSDKEVHILDPFVGTGNFITRVMQEIKKAALPYKYANELHCNEIMLLPYYIASMNIEHAYVEATGDYKPFEGICLVDTFELAETSQPSLFTPANTARVEKQKKAPIFVVIGNPPYNVGQERENENNKNRTHPEIDKRIRNTYAKDSQATLLNSLNDPYVKAIRWASDRIGKEGIVALVTNNGFVEGLAADGMRKHLAEDFSQIYIMDLGGNVRKNPKLSGSTHNVFGIQIGVSVNIFVRSGSSKKPVEVKYARLDEYFRKEQKYTFLDQQDNTLSTPMETLHPDKRYRWLLAGAARDFDEMMNSAELESSDSSDPETCFRLVSSGVQTNRDVWACSFQAENLQNNINKLIKTYNFERLRWHSSAENDSDLDSFVDPDETKISWSADLKKFLRQNIALNFNRGKMRETLFRPYTKMSVYFDEHVTERRSRFPRILPNDTAPNTLICVSRTAERPFNCIATNLLPNRVVTGGFGSASQCLPFYTYDEDGTNRRENITDWALEQFRTHYKDKSITKWDIFYYTYAVLHHPEYRTRYAANLKRELPRIPYARVSSASELSRSDKERGRSADSARSPDNEAFHAFAKAGKRLADLHVEYEKQKEYPLDRIEKPGEKLNFRVEKMRLSKDKATLVYNDFLTLTGIPKETYEYRLGNRSALEWVIDQYQVSTDKRSGITNDPNREDDPEYILRLIGQVITVSLETVKIVNALPDLGLPKEEADKKPVASAIQ